MSSKKLMAKNSQRARPWNFACGHCCAGGHFTRDLRHKSRLLARPDLHHCIRNTKCPQNARTWCVLAAASTARAWDQACGYTAWFKSNHHWVPQLLLPKEEIILGKNTDVSDIEKGCGLSNRFAPLDLSGLFHFCAGTAIHKEHKMLAFIPLHFFPEPQSWPSPNEQWPSCSKGTCGRQRSPTDGIWLK